MISQKDAAGLITFNDHITSSFPPKAYRSYLSQLFAALMELQPAEGTDLSGNLHGIAERIHKRSLIILISDLLDDPNKIIEGLKHFSGRHHEVLVFHITDPMEETFSFKRETEFVDSESGEKITVTPWQIRKEYKAAYSGYLDTLRSGCHQYHIEYIPVNTSTPLNDLLLKYLLKRRKG